MEGKNNSEKGKPDNLKWWVLFTVIIGTFLGRLDGTIVNLAMPKIISDFSITVSAAGWISTAYIIANAVFVPIWGKLGDSIGRKKVYIFGFSIFIFGSALAGFAWNLNSMIFFRIIQAIASSADYPTAMAIIAVTFREGKERAQALGIWSVSFAAAAVFGPLLGGPLIDYFGWRSVFLINIPIGLLGILLAVTFINESVSGTKILKFDLVGALTLGVFLSSLVLVLDKGIEWGWGSANSLISYLVCIVSFAIFIFTEKTHPDPLIDFKFFKNSVFVGALINNFAVFMAMIGAVFLVPLFVQIFLGYGATQTGILFMPMAVAMVLASAIGGKLVGKVKSNYIIFASTIIAALGIYLFAVMLDPRSGPIDVIIPISIMAFGMGLGMAQRTNIIASAVPQHEIGVASSVLALARNIAGAFGIAVFATILNSSIKQNAINLSANSHITDPAAYQQFVALIMLKSQMLAYLTVFKVAALVLFIASFGALFIKIKKESNIAVHVES